MKEVLAKNKILWGISILAILFETFRQFMSYSIVFRSYIYFLLWMVLCFVFAKGILKKINYFPIIFFIAVASLYVFRGGDYDNLKSLSRVISLTVGYMIIPTIYLFYNKVCSIRQIFFCVLIIFLVVTYTMICTAPIVIIQPGLIRETAYNEELYLQLQHLGVMNYALPHSIIFIIPALCFGMKYCTSTWLKWLCLVVFVESLVIVYMGEATTPLLLGVMAFFVSMLYNIHKNIRVNITRIAFVLLFLLLLLNESVLLYLINSIEPLFEGTAFAEKLHELELSLGVGTVSGGDLEARQDLIGNTINAIIVNPVFGTLNSKNIGGHNYLLDIWASLGLIGFVPLVAWLFYIVKVEYKSLPKCCRFYYLIGVFCFLFHAFNKSVWGGEFFLFPFFVLPCLLLLLYNKSKEYNPVLAVNEQIMR